MLIPTKTMIMIMITHATGIPTLEPTPCTELHEDEGGLNDNMHGIFLHILADTLGSVGVILSTIIVKFTGWKLIDPITSVLIALLILVSAIPLLKSSASNLLLGLKPKNEQQLRDVLNDVLKIPGVKSYTTPRFWPVSDVNSELIGYLHVQYYNSENSLSIKSKIDKLMEGKVKKCYLQLENEVDECWCRNEGIFSSH
ncbi:unnamed protein product [Ambrosiozyma monospora]|uniref:Unnamed protein product n=1 Tax=Ambrosiozyma monospora TaxID=43982 RepID=A0ACB5T8B6_AMBMO|nr:unnamed protein product [Ambrosiozyma monospora]